MSDGHEHLDDEPIAELRDLRLDPDPDLPGRVQRDINRRTLVADGLEFGFGVMLGTFWDHLRSLIDVWPGRNDSDRTDQDS